MARLHIQSEAQDKVAAVIMTAISSEIKRMEIGLEKTNRQIKKFEMEYNISSDNFLSNYTAENMKNADEGYIRWAGELKIRERILEDLNHLKDIEYAAS